MKIDLLNRLSEFYKDNPEMKGVPLTLNDINQVETTLQIKLPDDYKLFVSTYGGSYAGLAIYGLKNAEMMGDETVIDLTNRARKLLDELKVNNYILKSIVISDDGAGNPIFINEKGEVYIYYVDNDEYEKLGDSLGEVIEETFMSGDYLNMRK
ncbi:SMI1/KNR4 family protein [Acinetobacter baumannii]|uniref:SMI1/KNR4 family protein n=1 Tax=Acinetobacter baumannii TaxID=470 RepID=UPI0024DE0461|nr:SMI1/KNR4 family protein [Acinetobacter baumannii]MDK2172563.1 SMI1/KNR4 family protein [Acinetobacter baumannii]MDK2183383.1 SMI1/KNR4 family protein [Acinetobacter baumannii]MDK2329221.1 SMI1/KNR4 family protein [Acinetobacter baumannii]